MCRDRADLEDSPEDMAGVQGVWGLAAYRFTEQLRAAGVTPEQLEIALSSPGVVGEVAGVLCRPPDSAKPSSEVFHGC